MIDTETRLKALEDRIDALETLVADAQARFKTGYEALKKHPLFGQVASHLERILG